MNESRRGRVLVIDDDRVASDVIVKTLLPRGLDVEVAASPDRGIERAQESAPDLVFVSLFFPDSNGLKVSKRLHSVGGLEKVPVVMLISYKGELDPKYTTTIGIVDVLVKPLKPEEILSKTIAVMGEEALAKPDAEPPASPEADLYAGKEMPVGREELPSFSAAEQNEASLKDVFPGEGAGASGMEYMHEQDETGEFLKEEVSGETRVAPEELPQDVGAVGPTFEEEEPVRGGYPPLEEEIPFETRPGKFFAGKKLIAVSVISAALVLAIGSYGLKKILTRGGKTVQTRPAPAAPERVPQTKSGQAVSGDNGVKETDKGISAKADKERAVEARAPKQQEGTVKTFAPASGPQYEYSIQVGAFGSEKNAHSFAETMKKKGHDSFVEKEGGKPLYRVMIGRFQDARGASEQAKKLREEGLKTIVRRGGG